MSDRFGPGAGEALRRDHHRLEELYDELLDAFRAPPTSLLVEAWAPFAAGLREHMELEEAEVLPELERRDPTEVAVLRRDHVELRGLLVELDAAIGLERRPEEGVGVLMVRLREHAAREDALAYRWADETLPGPLA
jgi:hypothetical protein